MKLTKQQISIIASRVHQQLSKKNNEKRQEIIDKLEKDFYKTPEGKILEKFCQTFEINETTKKSYIGQFLEYPPFVYSKYSIKTIEEDLILSGINSTKTADEIIQELIEKYNES